ncbi:MAG: TCR/Tet family MFS transporter [Polyangiaceae bacterium]
MSKPAGKNAFFFIVVTVMIDMMGFGLIMPVTPTLVSELAHKSVEEAAPYGGYLSSVYALLNFVAAPILGSLSDRFGRRPVLLFSLAMLGADFLVMGLSTSLPMLFVGRILSGISGATFSTANAYIADTTEPEGRARAYGMLGGAFGVGFILGPVLGGLLGGLSSRAPFFAAAALAGVNTLYGFFILPESLAKEDRRPFEWKRANPFGAVRHLTKLPRVGWFILGIGLANFAQMVYPSTWSYHCEVRYHWSSARIGASLGMVGVGAAVVQAALIGQFLKRLGQRRTAFFGLAVGTIAFTLFSLASEGWMPFAIIPFSALAGVSTPAINATMTSLVDKSSQGELQGAVASVQALGNILSPLAMTSTLSFFTSPAAPIRFAGAPFLLAAILSLASMVPFAIGMRRAPSAARATPDESDAATDADAA